ncbi:MAG: hypothetical protein RLZZ316_703 [Bacteroidota bacterium]|jgi:protein TonB
MLRFILLLVLCCQLLQTTAQKKTPKQEWLYMLDNEWKATSNTKKAAYLLKQVQENDSLFVWYTYNVFGPLISIESFKDKAGNTAHGKFVFFNYKGTRDSMMYFKEGLADGDAYYFNDTGRVVLKKKYAAGRLMITEDIVKKDSIRMARKDNADTAVFSKVEVESEFPGGVRGWIQYLQKNLRYPDRAINSRIQGTVRIQFIVDKEGNIEEIEIVKSVEFTIDEEAMRLIRKSPQWTPAVQDGRKVKSYKIQPITFRLQ